MKHLPRIAAAGALFAVLGFSQTTDDLSAGWKSKLRFHAVSAYSPAPLAASLAWSGVLQTRDSPKEWGRSDDAFGERLGSTLAYFGVRNTLAFGLDTALHQDPRYYRSGDTGTWRRIGHALRGTILTRTDSGGETLATWRLGSAYGAAFLANEWQPDRVDDMKGGLTKGSAQMGIDLLANLGSEFWPDVRKKLFHR
jgi:hypothetical protein